MLSLRKHIPCYYIWRKLVCAQYDKLCGPSKHIDTNHTIHIPFCLINIGIAWANNHIYLWYATHPISKRIDRLSTTYPVNLLYIQQYTRCCYIWIKHTIRRWRGNTYPVYACNLSRHNAHNQGRWVCSLTTGHINHCTFNRHKRFFYI